MPLVQVQQGEPIKKGRFCDLFLLAFLLLHLNYQPCGYQSPSPTELSEVGGKACDAPPAAEEASRVWRSGQFFCERERARKIGYHKGSVTVNHDAVGLRGQGEPRKKHLLRQVLFSMISVPYGTDDISSIWYPLSADDICLRHMNGTDIISCLRRKYIIRRKPYIILRQQYIMKNEASRQWSRCFTWAKPKFHKSIA